MLPFATLTEPITAPEASMRFGASIDEGSKGYCPPGPSAGGALVAAMQWPAEASTASAVAGAKKPRIEFFCMWLRVLRPCLPANRKGVACPGAVPGRVVSIWRVRGTAAENPSPCCPLAAGAPGPALLRCRWRRGLIGARRRTGPSSVDRLLPRRRTARAMCGRCCRARAGLRQTRATPAGIGRARKIAVRAACRGTRSPNTQFFRKRPKDFAVNRF